MVRQVLEPSCGVRSSPTDLKAHGGRVQVDGQMEEWTARWMGEWTGIWRNRWCVGECMDE